MFRILLFLLVFSVFSQSSSVDQRRRIVKRQIGICSNGQWPASACFHHNFYYYYCMNGYVCEQNRFCCWPTTTQSRYGACLNSEYAVKSCSYNGDCPPMSWCRNGQCCSKFPIAPPIVQPPSPPPVVVTNYPPLTPAPPLPPAPPALFTTEKPAPFPEITRCSNGEIPYHCLPNNRCKWIDYQCLDIGCCPVLQSSALDSFY
uniref:WAP domain-containing protein n=1 Tax=Romanomermis culicivorax TaxID=13658 RepID=A0A915HE31_ROMCU